DLPAVGVVCPPLAEDVDGDGQPDLVATFGTVYQGNLPPWVEAVSGRTGRLLWRYALERDVKDPPRPNGHRVDTRYATVVIREGGKRILVVVAGRCVVGLDLQTGKPVWPVRDLGFEPFHTPVFADVTGTGQPALVLLQDNPISGEGLTVTAMSLAADVLWRHRVG